MADFMIALMSLSALGSVLAVILFLLKPLIKNKVSKAFSYYLWLVVLLRMCLPLGITLTVPAEWFTVSAEITETQPGGTELISELPGGGTGVIVPAPDVSAPVNGLRVAGAPPGSGAADAGNVRLGNARGALQALAGWLKNPGTWLLIWAAGALISLIWHVVGYIRFAVIIRRSAAAPDGEDLAVFRDYRESGRVRLVRSRFVKSPMLLGFLRPVIVLRPAAYVQSGSADDLRDILNHELTHYRRRDLLYKWFAMLVMCLHWFNPLIYLVRREIGRACELACDEAVISSLTPAQKQHYGETLMSLGITEAYPPGILATTMCEEKARLKERLMAIMNHKAGTWTAFLISLALLAGLLGCASVNSVGEAEPPVTPGTAAPEPSPSLAADVTLFENYGLTAAIPNEYIGKLIVMTEPEWEYLDDTTLISVYEKRSYEECRADYGEDAYAGFIFSIARYTQVQYEEFLASDGSGQSFFARDGIYYYGWFFPTDVQFYRSGGVIDTESEDWKEWEKLNDKCRDIKADFVVRNRLTPYSDNEFWDKEFT